MLYAKADDASARVATTAHDFPIVIIGAGFAGIGTAIQLKKAGIHSFRIFERAGEVGGTWRDNTYPGAACDVPSHVYSFSFEQNPEWSRMFAGSNEIQGYLLRCVEKYGIRPHLDANTSITEARWDDARGVWSLVTSRGERVEARVVISGVGGLVDPKGPDIPGLETFAGKTMHTARWDHEYDLAGKRVAVIGTGASAVQVVPAIAPKVGKLSVFQRSPAWVMPKRDHAISERTKERFRKFPWLLHLRRWFLYGLSELFGPMIFLDAPRLSRIGERMSERHLQQCVQNPVLREKLRPRFQFGCKRMLISDDYWPTFERPNVELVTERIAEVRPHAIVTADGCEHPIDVLVLATGFALNIATAPFPIFGRDGASLTDVWRRGAVAYKGVTVAGFPNWFILMGPNTGPGHTSVLAYTEAQIQYALQAIRRMITDPTLRSVEVRRDVQDAYNAGIQGRMKHMVWSTGCSSWYLSPDGENHALYPGLASEYRARTRTFKASEYHWVHGTVGSPVASAPRA
jgi:cation diffusion facilitator CzcD-associated flavoprotein CzcO